MKPAPGGKVSSRIRYPALLQVNTRVWLNELSRKLGRPASLDDIPDADLERAAQMGFQWLWFLSVWQTGMAGLEMSRSNPEWHMEFRATLEDLQESDILGSGFAISGYSVHHLFGGDAALARLRKRLRKHGLRLMLDFVPNHTALDHPWVETHPEYFVHGTESDLVRTPSDYTWVKRKRGAMIMAHGRDPSFSGWVDTLQLDYSHPGTGEAMQAELLKIAGQCDGVRCDMAMLLLPDVFLRTWGRKSEPFWPKAIQAVKSRSPEFVFMAEVYWDLEWTLQQQGFDYTYDKKLYDRLRAGAPRPVRDHLVAEIDFQDKLVRFLENHDEPRAAAAFAPGAHEAAATITYLSPGMRFFHQGQLEGRKKRISAHICRAPREPVDHALEEFYRRLLAVLRRPTVHKGAWWLLECLPAWEGNGTWDDVVAFAWEAADKERILVTVNQANHQSQCYVRLPFPGLAGRVWRLEDLMGSAVYDRDGLHLQGRGLYLDVAPWQVHVFLLTPAP